MAFSRIKNVFLIALFAFALSTLVASQAQAAGIAWRESLPKALSEAKRTGKPVFLDFTATWCGPCQEMKKETFTDSKVITELKRWVSVHIDVDKQESVAMKYKVEAMPTLIIVKPSGAVVSTAIGYRDGAGLTKWLKANYAKARR
jgi:thiol:disulfide interchange protein